MTKYVILIEKAKKGFSAYSPDLPGCVATGRTRQIAERRMRQALAFHVAGLRVSGERVPRPTTTASYVEVAA
jgi:predicted RNase H-like HicB family nuclease